MSRSNPTLKNPATRFIRWRGGEEGGGKLTWYDKETESEEVVKLPFSFLVLDELNTVTGFSDAEQSGYWANEVKNITKDELVVKTKTGTKGRGKWADLGEVKSKGAKYAKSIYIAFKDDSGELVIGNLQVFGAALTAWIEYSGKFNVMECATFVTDEPVKKTKGKNTYFVPVFEGQNVSEETEQAAKALDKELQSYLGQYFAQGPVSDDPTEEDDGPAKPSRSVEAVDIEDIDEKQPEAKVEARAEKPADDGKINLKDVPF